MKDILLVDKPIGITSFDVIRILRRQTGIRKMGHAGTLDPLASGLMIIGINQGTKKLTKFIGLSKVYEAEILLGKKTTTGDLEGDVTEEKEVGNITKKQIEKVLKEITGKIELPVPIYSAVKQKGQPLYKRVRKGESVKPPIKTMEIQWIKLKKFSKTTLSIELEVSSGTYIRSIAEEIGKRLNLPATLSDLKRTRIGNFSLAKARQLE
jgi:tRNA pseudouridine55 synthase